mgnify:CR=1 FL=1
MIFLDTHTLRFWHRFWRQHPAFFLGISVLLGSFGIVWPIWAFLLYLPLLITLPPASILPQLALFCAVRLSFFGTYPSEPLQEKGVLGRAEFAIRSVHLSHTHFGSRWVYRGELVRWDAENGEKFYGLPCSFSLSSFSPRPTADSNYRFWARLIQKRGSFLLKTHTHTHWEKVEGTWSLAEARYHWKERVTHWIRQQIPSRPANHLLAAIVTGQLEDLELKGVFFRFGLLHLLAISGFHFTILTTVLQWLLRPLPSEAGRLLLLFGLLSTYFFFLGPLPSVLRAWMMAILGMGGDWLHRPKKSLNFLGAALVLNVLLDPFCWQNIGFQLSFVATLALLLFSTYFAKKLESLFPKRPLSTLLLMDRKEQHLYLLLGFFRQALALNCAVSLAVAPILLYHFSQFPWLSLLYNLFFPGCLALSFVLLVVAIATSWLPLVGPLFFACSGYYTSWLLQLLSPLPTLQDPILYWSGIPFLGLIFYLMCLLAWGLHLKSDPKHQAFPVTDSLKS